MSDTPLEVRLQLTSPAQFAAGRTDKPAVERRNPTKVTIYQADSGIDVILDPVISTKQQLVQIGPKMDMWTSQQMTEDAIKFSVAGVKPLANDVPINVTGPEPYLTAFEAAYSKI